MRRLYQRRVPTMFYDYCESGSWTESTFRDNVAALGNIKFRQRVMVNLENRSIASSVLDQPLAMPVALAPVGLAGMQHADGEIHAARAAEKSGVPFCLSTMSICSIEDVADHVSQPFWFQLYVMRDRDFIGRLIDRARVAGCSALMLTVDLQILGQRHKDIKNGLSTPPKLGLRTALDIARCPRWAVSMLGTSRRQFGNVVGHVEHVGNLGSLSDWTNSQFDPRLTWDDVKWIKDRWGGPLILKGIMEPEDAALAVAAGADAIVVSNHGGRQLDGAPAAIDALPAVVREVGGQTEVLMDGGIRTGQDIFRALAMGARAVLIGRAYIYGLGAMGEAGVSKVLEILAKELDLTMAFCGLRDVQDVTDAVIWQPAPGENNG